MLANAQIQTAPIVLTKVAEIPVIAERDTGQLASPKPGLDIAIALDREELFRCQHDASAPGYAKDRSGGTNVANWERRIATEVLDLFS